MSPQTQATRANRGQRYENLPPSYRKWVDNIYRGTAPYFVLPEIIKHTEVLAVLWWKSWDSVRRQYENRYGRKLTGALSRMGARLTSMFEETRNVSFLARLESVSYDLVVPVLKELHTETQRRFLQEASNLYADQLKARGWQIIDPFDVPAMVRWTNSILGARIKNIDDTTRNAINRLITQGLRDGRSIDSIASDISRLHSFSETRGFRIARTEVISSSNAASYFGVEANQRTDRVTKSWLATKDKRTRPSHDQANGQQQPFKDPFLVGGAQLLFPGDSSMGAPGREIINCRCVATYASSRRTPPGPPPPVRPGPPPKPRQSRVPKPTPPPAPPKPVRASVTEARERLQQSVARLAEEERALKEKNRYVQFEANPARRRRKLDEFNTQLEELRAQRLKSMGDVLGSGRDGKEPDIQTHIGGQFSRAQRDKIDRTVSMFKQAFRGSSDLDNHFVEFKYLNSGGRAYAQRLSAHQSLVGLTDEDDISTIIHELGHVMEHASKHVEREANAFLSRRTQGEATQRLSDITGNQAYGPGEVTKKDQFFSAYVGKQYPGGWTEVTSMGLEAMYTDFKLLDSEHFEVIYNMVGATP